MTLRNRHWNLLLWTNFLWVALLGLLMRYKIIAPLPWLEQKNLIQAHVHFAFNGWIGLGFLIFLTGIPSLTNTRNHNYLLGYYFLCLVQFFGFLFFGYCVISLVITVLLQIPLWLAIGTIYNGRKSKPELSLIKICFGFAFLFLMLSQLSLILLHVKMIRLDLQQSEYMGIWYFFLHFSYNGWFIFGIFSLILGNFPVSRPSNLLMKTLLIVLGICVIPTYLLSLLWLNDASWMKTISWIFSFVQLCAFLVFIRLLHACIPHQSLQLQTKWFWSIALLSLSIKYFLQFFQNFELFEQIAFSHRSIVIGYLHLIFLGFVTMFFIGYLFERGVWNSFKKSNRFGLFLIGSGIILNELTLMIQGILSIQLKLLPGTNILLFAFTLVIITGIITLIFSVSHNTKTLEKTD